MAKSPWKKKHGIKVHWCGVYLRFKTEKLRRGDYKEATVQVREYDGRRRLNNERHEIHVTSITVMRSNDPSNKTDNLWFTKGSSTIEKKNTQ